MESQSEPAAVAMETLRSRLIEASLIALLTLTLNLAGNGRMSLWDRDEPRYAGCAREMRANGDWLHPTFNNEPRYHKPVLIYWLMLGGTTLFGDNPFGARFMSAIAGTATCLLIWGLGRRMLGKKAGRMAALILATSPIMVAESKLATTDATLTLWFVVGQFTLWELASRPSRWLAALFWVSVSLATLTKGPVGVALLAVSGLATWLFGGPVAGWKRLRWRWGLALFVLLTAPWFIAIGIRTNGAFYQFALGKEVLKRVSSGVETHGGFPGYYLAGSLVLFYPFSAVLPPAIVGAWRQRASQPALAFLLGWVLGPWILLELVQTKLIHYFLPSYGACALLAAWLLERVAESGVNLRRWPMGRLAMGLLTGVGITFAIGLLAGAVVLPTPMLWPSLLMSVVIACGTLYAVERFQRGATERAALGLVATWASTMLLLGGWLLPSGDRYRLTPMVASRLDAIAKSEDARPMTANYQPPGLVYEIGRPIAAIQASPGWVKDVVDGNTKVVAALDEREIALLQRNPKLALDIRDTIRGFNVERGRVERLRMVVIRSSRGSSTTARRPEQSLVK